MHTETRLHRWDMTEAYITGIITLHIFYVYFIKIFYVQCRIIEQDVVAILISLDANFL